MKKTLFTCMALLAIAPFCAFAQDPDATAQDALATAAQTIANAPQKEEEAPKPKYWTNSIVLDLGLNQTFLSNWAAGGYNTVTLNTGLDAKAEYAKDLASWNNRLQMQYGFLYSDEREGLIQKNTDRLYFESKFGYKTSKESKWSYSAAYDFRTQFTNDYTYKKPADGQTWMDAATLKSGFLSPAYMNLGLGIDWVPCDWFNMNMAPLTGSLIIVRNELLRKNYGMKLTDDTLDPEIGANYSKAKFQLGAQIKANLKLKINDNFGYESQLVLFSNYLEKPQNLRVNWDNGITWQLTKYFKFGFNTWLIYDPDVLIADKNGNNLTQRIQFKEFTTFNLTWTFSNKK